MRLFQEWFKRVSSSSPQMGSRNWLFVTLSRQKFMKILLESTTNQFEKKTCPSCLLQNPKSFLKQRFNQMFCIKDSMMCFKLAGQTSKFKPQTPKLR